MPAKKTRKKPAKKQTQLGRGKKALEIYKVPKELIEKKEKSEKFIRKNPLLSVAAAAFSGYVIGKTLGRLFRRRK